MEDEAKLTEEQREVFMRNLVGKVRENFYQPSNRNDIRKDIDEQIEIAKADENPES